VDSSARVAHQFKLGFPLQFVSRYHSDPWWVRGEAISLTAIPESRVSNRADGERGGDAGPLDAVQRRCLGIAPVRGNPASRPTATGYRIRHADAAELRNCGVSWESNGPDDFTHALEAENFEGLDLTGFSGVAVHPERYSDVSIR